MILSTSIYRRAKRDGRNPSTGAKSMSFEERRKLAEEKRKKLHNEIPIDVQSVRVEILPPELSFFFFFGVSPA